MLITKKVLTHALTDLNGRNTLIKTLDLSAEGDKQCLYKWVLAFWLGSNITRAKLHQQSLSEESKKLIDAGYFCILILDKQMSVLKNHDPVYQRLKNTLSHMMHYVNNNYLLLTQNPSRITDYFIALFEHINNPSDDKMVDYKILQLTQKAGLAELANPQPGPLIRKAANDVTRITSMFNLGVLLNKVITENFNQVFFFPLPATLTTHSVEKLLIPAKDGVILEGLSIKEKGKQNKTVVLALIGHFQAEHYYLSSSFYAFQDLFDTQLVLINHRNYSNRSNQFASHPLELADDVVAFAHYFRERNKALVLYGMCGGAAHMILAAHRLLNQKIPFKLILDRFSQQYSDFADYKTLSRMRNHLHPLSQKQHFSWLPTFCQTPLIIHFLTVLIFITLYIVLKSTLHITKSAINFGQLLQAIPESDRLILQAKGRKTAPSNQPVFTDLIVHPQNDLRQAVKEKRNQRKSLLNSLAEHCLKAAGHAVFSPELQQIFIQLFQRFHQCLELISNEKLTSNTVTGGIKDLHSSKLYTLTTRNKLPMQQFITGFFRQPQKPCHQVIQALRPYPIETIVGALKQHYDDSPSNASNFLLFANHLALFLEAVKANESFVISMGNRLSSTRLPDLSSLINALLNSTLFEKIDRVYHGQKDKASFNHG